MDNKKTKGKTALMPACSNGHRPIVLALNTGRTNFVKSLIRRQSNAFASGTRGRTAFMAAANGDQKQDTSSLALDDREICCLFSKFDHLGDAVAVDSSLAPLIVCLSTINDYPVLLQHTS